MKNIPLYVLDEYAKRLTNNQVNKLYEHKTHKTYNPLYETLDNTYKLYLNAYTISEELDASKSELIMHLSEKCSDLMENLSYKIGSDAVTFVTESRDTYGKLLHSLMEAGLSAETIEDIRDKKY